MGSSGRYWCRPLHLLSISYAFQAHFHGRGRSGERDQNIWSALAVSMILAASRLAATGKPVEIVEREDEVLRAIL